MGNAAAYLAERSALVERRLCEILPQLPQPAAVLGEAMSYSLLAGGKRLRPIFFLATAESFGLAPADLLDFACGLEMIHTFSLIHDDLPAMDNDDFRRGKPSCHKAFGEDVAILAGDGLLIQAFGVMAGCQTGSTGEQQLAAILAVAQATGLAGMLVGQTADVVMAEQEKTLAELAWIDRYKTGALFISSLRSAGILAGASRVEQDALAKFGEQFGIAFQIMDDILDVTGDPAKLGKPLGSDLKNGKSTYPGLLGLTDAAMAAKDATAAAIAALAPLGEKGCLLADLAQMLLTREA